MLATILSWTKSWRAACPEHAARGRGVEFVRCPKCKRSVLDQASNCPWCDTRIDSRGAGKAEKSPVGRGGPLATVVAAGLGAAALMAYFQGWLPAPGTAPPPEPTAQPTPAAREDTRFGLTETQRRGVYQDILGAED